MSKGETLYWRPAGYYWQSPNQNAQLSAAAALVNNDLIQLGYERGAMVITDAGHAELQIVEEDETDEVPA